MWLMGKIYAICNQKGGVGKSTSTVCLGVALGELGNRVLLVDLDPQASLTVMCGIDPESLDVTVYHALIEQATLEEVIRALPWGIDLVGSNINLAGAEGELIGQLGWDRSLSDALEPVMDRYDFILIDCSPSLGVLTLNSLVAAHHVIIPVQTEYLAMRGIKQLRDVIAKVVRKGNPNLSAKLLLTMHNPRTVHNREIVDELHGVFGKDIYKSVIRRTVKVSESTVAGEPFVVYAPRSPVAVAYRELAKEVVRD